MLVGQPALVHHRVKYQDAPGRCTLVLLLDAQLVRLHERDAAAAADLARTASAFAFGLARAAAVASQDGGGGRCEGAEQDGLDTVADSIWP